MASRTASMVLATSMRLSPAAIAASATATATVAETSRS